MAGVELPGKARQLPIPGKVRILRSSAVDVAGKPTWIDMDVDYRAEANRLSMAAPDARNVWVATDTGMILKLTPSGATTRK